MSDHRYDDDDVREILARATEVRTDPGDVLPPELSDGGATADPGLTLGELRKVAEEVGIPAERIDEAAAALELDRAGLPPAGRYWGIELATGHAARLPRMLTDGEWERFVVRLRDTFQARGEMESEGSLRSWSNGNLQVLLEPLPQGARIRFTSRDDASKSYVDGALALLTAGAMTGILLLGVSLLGGEAVPWGLWALIGSLPALGGGLWAWGRAKAGRWLPLRQHQFRRLGAEAQAAVSDRQER